MSSFPLSWDLKGQSLLCINSTEKFTDRNRTYNHDSWICKEHKNFTCLSKMQEEWGIIGQLRSHGIHQCSDASEDIQHKERLWIKMCSSYPNKSSISVTFHNLVNLKFQFSYLQSRGHNAFFIHFRVCGSIFYSPCALVPSPKQQTMLGILP